MSFWDNICGACDRDGDGESNASDDNDFYDFDQNGDDEEYLGDVDGDGESNWSDDDDGYDWDGDGSDEDDHDWGSGGPIC